MKIFLLNTITFVFFCTASNAQLTLTLQPDGANGKDAFIAGCVPCGFSTSNYGGNSELNAIAWTNGGNISNGRGLLEFDLSGLPANINLVSAKLSLYFNPTSVNGQHSTLSGSNEAVIQRIISSWDEYSVTWDNQPASTTQNEVTIPASTTATQNYPDIDITSLIQDIIDNPATGHGLMIRLVTEEAYRSLIFASSDHSDANLHPKLVLTYYDLAGLEDVQEDAFKIHPNPANEQLNLHFNGSPGAQDEIVISDSQGRQIIRTSLSGNQTSIDIRSLPKGFYVIHILSDNTVAHSQQFLKE